MSNKTGIASSVDYLTITARGSKRGAALISQCAQLAFGSDGQLPIQEPWYFKGFRGYRSGGIRYGTNNHRDGIVQLSGPDAEAHWRKFDGYWDNCSRIDLAVTIVLPAPDTAVAVRVYNRLNEQRKVKAAYIQNNRGGATAYIGARSSSRYARVYDKGAQQNREPGVEWRYEVEYKKPVSAHLYQSLLDNGGLVNLIALEVRDHFRKYGIEIPYAPTDPHSAIEIARDLTNSEKKLQWLERQVQPAIRQLLEEGLESRVLVALGLGHIGPDWLDAFGKDGF